MKSLKIYTVAERPPEDEEVILLIQKKACVGVGNKITASLVKAKRRWQGLDDDGYPTSISYSYKHNPEPLPHWRLVIYDKYKGRSLNDDDLYSTTESIQSLFDK
jgi:hypothetical protein